MLTSIADNQFAIIGCVPLLKLRALARVILPTSTGLWTESTERRSAFELRLGLYEYVSYRLAGQGQEHLNPQNQSPSARIGPASIPDTHPSTSFRDCFSPLLYRFRHLISS